jgi:hypothetical protein
MFFRQRNIKIYIIFNTHNVSDSKLVGCHIYVIRLHMPSSKDQCNSPSNRKQQQSYVFHKAVMFFAFYMKN